MSGLVMMSLQQLEQIFVMTSTDSSASPSKVATCLGFAWMDFPAGSKTLPDMKCYGVTRYSLSPSPSFQKQASLPLGNSTETSLRAFGCMGSTSVVMSSPPTLRYKGVAIQVHEDVHLLDAEDTPGALGNEIDDDDDISKEPIEGFVSKAWTDLGNQASAQGYSSTSVFFASKVADRSGAILTKQVEWFSKNFRHPLIFSKKIISKRKQF